MVDQEKLQDIVAIIFIVLSVLLLIAIIIVVLYGITQGEKLSDACEKRGWTIEMRVNPNHCIEISGNSAIEHSMIKINEKWYEVKE